MVSHEVYVYDTHWNCVDYIDYDSDGIIITRTKSEYKYDEDEESSTLVKQTNIRDKSYEVWLTNARLESGERANISFDIENDAVVSGSAIKYTMIEINLTDEIYSDSKLYTISEDGTETLNVTVTHEIIGEYSKTVWQYTDGRKKVWYCYADDFENVYYAEYNKNGDIIQGSVIGVNPESP